jgi:hypothetical protein
VTEFFDQCWFLVRVTTLPLILLSIRFGMVIALEVGSLLQQIGNFNAKSVDSDFTAITNMATGAFSTQAKEFFNSNIRSSLEKALAESRGQVRALDVQSENQAAGTASVYAVVDQTYVNDKINTPQADVVRLTADLQRVDGVWKISDVTVLEGATPGSQGSASGSAGSNVPGQ